jgi:hypothetical protein
LTGGQGRALLATVNPGRERQSDIFLAGVRGKQPVVPADPERLEQAAREQISAEAFAYLAGGAGTEQTMAANRDAFARRRIAPRMLRDVSERDLRRARVCYHRCSACWLLRSWARFGGE